jgi:hypothetical protein
VAFRRAGEAEPRASGHAEAATLSLATLPRVSSDKDRARIIERLRQLGGRDRIVARRQVTSALFAEALDAFGSWRATLDAAGLRDAKHTDPPSVDGSRRGPRLERSRDG